VAQSLALQIAEWCERVHWDDVPARERAAARLRILDTLGLVYAALDTPAGRIALEIATRQGGAPESTLATGARLPAPWTALAHATLAHARDFDDTFADSVVHPGSVVVPVALAVGEATEASGAEVMLAITLGYEVAARLGAAAGRNLHARGFHATGVIGPLAAAVTAAKLYRLDAHATAQAMGLAGSMAGGLMEFLADGSWSKWLHTGWAAHGGIVAAQFAGAGFHGPVSVLEGRAGLYRAFLGDGIADLEAVVAHLGSEWRGSAAQFKVYPCAHVIQPYIDAVLELSAAHALSSTDIKEVTCAIAPWAVPIVGEPRAPRLKPQNEMQAIASLPYMVARALAHGTVTLEALAPGALSDSTVLALAERVRHVEDATLGTGFDGRVAIRMRDGREFSARAAAGAVDGAKVRAKFRRNAAAACTPSRIAAIEAAIDDEAFEARKLMPLYFARS
jgi:2-methylcitrate dehydratase PrpD